MSVISSVTRTPEISPHRKPPIAGIHHARAHMAALLMWFCLLLACIGTGWFAFQYFLVPQQQSYAPQWHTAQWIQPTDVSSPTAYFRYSLMLNTFPENAFATVTANQSFQFYVNGVFVKNNTQDLLQGESPRTYMFNINAPLINGLNTISILVKNLSNGTPQLRASIGIVDGQHTTYFDTNTGWQATGQALLAHPRNANGLSPDIATMINGVAPPVPGTLPVISPNAWELPTFDASAWSHAIPAHQYPANSFSLVNPVIYTYPLPDHWLSVGIRPESFFVRRISVPAGFQDAFIRIVATGKAAIFINDHQFFSWDGQVLAPQINVVATLQAHNHLVPYHNGLQQGIYDITPYLHAGTNTIAVHVQSPGNTTSKVGLNSYKSALSMDLLAGSDNTYHNLLAPDADWRASAYQVPGWTSDNSATASWSAPSMIGRPGNNLSYYLSDPTTSTSRNEQLIPPMLVAETLIYSISAVLALWLLLALVLLPRYYRTQREAFESASLVFIPALAIEITLLTLSRETLLPQPFPFTTFWGALLIMVVILSTLGLWLHARYAYQGQTAIRLAAYTGHADDRNTVPFNTERHKNSQVSPQHRLYRWLRQNWGLFVIMVLAIPMACYHISYEPFWQDELSSYYASLYIMSHGYPAFPSGFIYPKGELFSYIMAVLMSIFGTGGKLVPRCISTTEYLASLPIYYILGQKLTNRKIALLATAMLAFSPYTMVWSRQARMYEQAQFLAIFVVYMFWHAIQLRNQKRPIYLAMLALLIAYFSHEEIFIAFPSIIACTLLGSRAGRYGIPAILRKKHWWQATGISVAIIMIQLMIVHWSHPPTFATDQSRKPPLLLTSSNLPYYFTLLFSQPPLKALGAPWSNIQPWSGADTILVVVGCILAFIRKDKRMRYCALFLLLATLTLTFLFTMQADRYYYPLLPVYYLLGAYAFWSILGSLWHFARPYLTLRQQKEHTDIYPRTSLSRPVRCTLITIVALLSFSLLIAPALPLGNYNLFISQALGLNYRHHFADYDNAAQYVKAHIRPGDTVISIAPAVITLYYVGRVDYYLSVDHALFLYEQDGQILETTSGAKPIFNQQELQNILASHPRVWIVTDNGNYQAGANRNGRFSFPPPDFRMVYEGYGSAIYARSSDG